MTTIRERAPNESRRTVSWWARYDVQRRSYAYTSRSSGYRVGHSGGRAACARIGWRRASRRAGLTYGGTTIGAFPASNRRLVMWLLDHHAWAGDGFYGDFSR